jgi:hypothetical protein
MSKAEMPKGHDGRCWRFFNSPTFESALSPLLRARELHIGDDMTANYAFLADWLSNFRTANFRQLPLFFACLPRPDSPIGRGGTGGKNLGFGTSSWGLERLSLHQRFAVNRIMRPRFSRRGSRGHVQESFTEDSKSHGSRCNAVVLIPRLLNLLFRPCCGRESFTLGTT